MNVYLDYEFESEEDIKDFLYREKFLKEDSGKVVILYIDRYLRDDKTINLELLELSVKFACESLPSTIAVSGFEKYTELREIDPSSDSTRKEFNFIRGHIQSLISEYSEEEVKLICLVPLSAL